MPGSLASVGVIAGAVILTAGLAAIGTASVAGQRLASAADAAALAAADAASGAVTGVPCELADEVAGTFGAHVESCDLDGLVATVTVELRVGPVATRASARAGPPP
ncbi:MAG: Rv3654c family TadE-like protein [Microbacterium sp.]|uniref:Rv3654c family TadE-like protein n=1 Tax=Microbacterium sp. TaxID=51671 RepID=UPI003F818C7F